MYDVVRAGVKFYFGLKDPRGPRHARWTGRDPTVADWLERLKDAVAEARVEHRRGYDSRGDRGHR